MNTTNGGRCYHWRKAARGKSQFWFHSRGVKSSAETCDIPRRRALLSERNGERVLAGKTKALKRGEKSLEGGGALRLTLRFQARAICMGKAWSHDQEGLKNSP